MIILCCSFWRIRRSFQPPHRMHLRSSDHQHREFIFSFQTIHFTCPRFPPHLLLLQSGSLKSRKIFSRKLEAWCTSSSSLPHRSSPLIAKTDRGTMSPTTALAVGAFRLRFRRTWSSEHVSDYLDPVKYIVTAYSGSLHPQGPCNLKIHLSVTFILVPKSLIAAPMQAA